MRKIGSFIAAVLLLCSMCTVTHAGEFETWYVDASALNCRTEPSMDGEIITTFPEGTELTIIGCQDAWWQVYNGEIVGWCFGRPEYLISPLQFLAFFHNLPLIFLVQQLSATILHSSLFILHYTV